MGLVSLKFIGASIATSYVEKRNQYIEIFGPVLGDDEYAGTAFDLLTCYVGGEALGLAAKGPAITKGPANLTLKGTDYTPEYVAKLQSAYKMFQKQGYDIGEHGLNRIFGRINQGKINSMDQVFDVLKNGTKYTDAARGGTVVFKDGVSVHIAENGYIKTVIGNNNVKSTWELIK